MFYLQRGEEKGVLIHLLSPSDQPIRHRCSAESGDGRCSRMYAGDAGGGGGSHRQSVSAVDCSSGSTANLRDEVLIRCRVPSPEVTDVQPTCTLSPTVCG